MNESAIELRRIFLDYFKAHEHRIVHSSPLVPVGDPTLLFTTAGMVQFKPLYGIPDPEYTRAASCQKCLRATDIDNVGHTLRHHTFFEMLGNFSFGDYFKHEAIVWGWEWITEVLGIPKEPIWVTVHTTDDEAAEIWARETDIRPERIVRLGDEDNFWGPAGGTGACGPSSEMYWDLGPEVDPSIGEGDLTAGDRYIEFWNLVFPQFNQLGPDERVRLDHPGIDTGMGLERLAVIVQGVGSPYETDLFQPIIRDILDMIGRAEMPSGDERVAVRVIADHMRGLTFALADGVVFSNEGRGYVLRRLLRRAGRRGRAMGVDGPFLHQLVGTVIDHYGDAYPELRRMGSHVERQMLAEEERFARTLDAGVNRFEAMVAKVREAGLEGIAGEDVFQLYDTYGFPVDLTTEMATERGLAVDHEGFERAMQAQRERARAAAQFKSDDGDEDGGPEWTTVSAGEHSEFLGYDTLLVDTVVRHYRSVGEGDAARVELVLAETPFYAESGGQIGDRGTITGGGATVEIDDTVKGPEEAVVHRGRLTAGRPEDLVRDNVTVAVDAERRAATVRNHTATHLLHAALREVLGEHVQQHGSLVAPDRLRFDFSHFQAMTDEEIRRVEDLVNRAILANHEVRARYEPYGDAIGRGAMALFGEKYGAEVRTIEVPGVSLELCGGTHCSGTGDIGLCKITSESAIGAGVRRIEAVTGMGSLAVTRGLEDQLRDLAGMLGVAPRALPERLQAMLRDMDALKTQVKEAQGGGLDREIQAALEGAEEHDGRRIVVAKLSVSSVPMLRDAGDAVRDRLGSGAAVLGAVIGAKVNFLTVVTDDLIKGGVIKADELVREVAKVAGGSGGGKPHQALAGGKEVGKLDEALECGRRLLRERLLGKVEQS
jgi:alanyl-tRNA synthetase